MSALLRLEHDRFALLPLAAALAVCEGCESIAPVTSRIKWPNDVLIESRKAAGILIESRAQEGWAVVGIGLNVDTGAEELDPELRDSAISLRIAAGRPVDREDAFGALLERLAEWTGGVSRDRLLDAYRERDALRGRRVSFSRGGNVIEGEAAGIDDDGNLIVFADDGDRLTLDSGEVHLLTR
jgi:BirA family transcriptional regulator, biotin operon repressor / biotin---[acetyl-CoA-carboxylase] ligase